MNKSSDTLSIKYWTSSSKGLDCDTCMLYAFPELEHLHVKTCSQITYLFIWHWNNKQLKQPWQEYYCISVRGKEKKLKCFTDFNSLQCQCKPLKNKTEQTKKKREMKNNVRWHMVYCYITILQKRWNYPLACWQQRTILERVKYCPLELILIFLWVGTFR